MQYDIKKLSLKEKIGQMIGLAFAGGEYSPELAMQIEEIEAGLIIYFKDNCLNPKQIFELNKTINSKAKIPPFIALDQEGGMVARVTTGVTQSPGAMAITAGSSKEAAYTLAYNMGKELRHLGFNFNFAPEGDVNNNPANPVINVRSYSENPEVVAEYMHEAVKGYTDALMMSSVKHFPGHGDTSVDSHKALPTVSHDQSTFDNIDLVPFKQYIDGVEKLFAYIEDPANKIDAEALIFYGGHDWQKGDLEKLDMQYLHDMRTLIEQIGKGTAEYDPQAYNPTLNANFKYGTAKITWNTEFAKRFAEEMAAE